MNSDWPGQGFSTCGVDLICSAPTGHVEIEEIGAVEIKGDDEVPPDRARKRHPHVHHLAGPQNRNPKHTGLNPRTED